MINKIVSLSLKNKLLIGILSVVLFVSGIVAFKQLPIEAYPNISATQVQIITQWPGHAAEEVESQITIPTEIVMNGLPHKTDVRSVSLFGLSVVTITFDDQTNSTLAYQYVNEYLPEVNLPPGLQPTLSPDSPATGQIFWYWIDAPDRSPMWVKTLEDWELEKRFEAIPGVAGDNGFGGLVKQYQVLLNPILLANYGLNVSNVVHALSNNNQNAGGGFLPMGNQFFYIRGIGRVDDVTDIGNVVITEKSGVPIRVKDVGDVVIGHKPRLGNIAVSFRRANGTVENRNDVVEGTIDLRTGVPAGPVLDAIHKEVSYLNTKYLPTDVKIRSYLDRSDLIRQTTHTVERNLLSGMLLVFVILLLFLGNMRSALIVAITVPLALLFASILLDLKHISANLLSLGAIDFGMIVDGAVVMTESIFRHKMQAQSHDKKLAMDQIVIKASREVERPIVYAILIMIFAYLPIFTFQRVEGKLFSPLAWTVTFALFGAVLLALTLTPVLCSHFLKGEVREWRNPFMEWLQSRYKKSLNWVIDKNRFMVGVGVLCFALTLILVFCGAIGSEFLPHLDEGTLWIRGTLPPSTSFKEAEDLVTKERRIYMSFPEVPFTACQMGRPDDGTDSTGFFDTECFVDLVRKSKWRPQFHNRLQIIHAMDKDLRQIPGVIWNFSQPIEDNVEEALSGVKGALVVKVFGRNLELLNRKAIEIKNVLAHVRGIADLGVFEELGQPNVDIHIDRNKIARYGLNISDVQNVIETAVAGRVATHVINGEKTFDLVVRYLPQFRDSIAHIRRILVATPAGYRIPLEDLAQIKIVDGASEIYRDDNSRYIAIKFSVRGRDLGSTIAEAQKRVRKTVLLPPGYDVKWTGEFKNMRRANARLRIVIPITILGIFFILFLMFDSIKMALIILANVAFARIGGVLALLFTGTNFSISSGVGFLAVFGVSVQTGVLLVSFINQFRDRGLSIREAVIEGSSQGLRPIMITALVATFGLLPAALSHAIGSDSQRPMAIVIVGGLLADLVMSFFLLPALYIMFARPKDKYTHEQTASAEDRITIQE